MKRLFTFGVALLMAAGRTLSAQAAPNITSLDSIALERSGCYGTCPAYRLTLNRSGAIRFLSRNNGDTNRVERDSIRPRNVAALLWAADSLGFFRLPPIIAKSPELCPDRATDHATVTLGLFGSGRVEQIVDYQGCFLRSDHSTAAHLQDLRRFERLVDSVAGSSRWVRPNPRRRPVR